MQEKLPLSEDATDQEILIRCKTFRDALRLSLEKSGKSHKVICYELSERGYNIDTTILSLALAENPSQKKNFPTEAIDAFVELTTDIPLRYLALRRGCGIFRLKSTLEIENEQLKAQLIEKEKELSIIRNWEMEKNGK